MKKLLIVMDDSMAEELKEMAKRDPVLKTRTAIIVSILNDAIQKDKRKRGDK